MVCLEIDDGSRLRGLAQHGPILVVIVVVPVELQLQQLLRRDVLQQISRWVARLCVLWPPVKLIFPT